MKARQRKKNLKKAIELLNSLFVEEFDSDGDGILYINVSDSEATRATINKICALQDLNRDGMLHAIQENQNEMSIDTEPQIDLVFVYEYMRMPKNQDLVFSYKNRKGFSLQGTKSIPE